MKNVYKSCPIHTPVNDGLGGCFYDGSMYMTAFAIPMISYSFSEDTYGFFL